MRKRIWLAAMVWFVAAPGNLAAQTAPQSPQSTSQTQPAAQGSAGQPAAKPDPLVIAARKAREAQKNAPKTVMVFTNDNIPKAPGDMSIVGARGSSEPSSGSGGEAAKAKSPNKNSATVWRKKFAAARHKLARDQEELSILQRESSQIQLQYYPNPTKALMQGYSRSDINKKAQAIAAKQKEIEADQQAISNLEDALRRAGGDPGWARE